MLKSVTKNKKEKPTVDEDSIDAGIVTPQRKVSIVSLFSGAGGLDVAACRSGKIEAILSTDSNATFLSTVEKNLPNHFPGVRHVPIVANAWDLSGFTIKELLGLNPDLVMGGPPCDDFTTSGRRRGIQGDKGPLIFEFLRLVDELRPSCFIFENVPNLLRQFKGVFQAFIQKSSEIGYTNKWALLKSCDFGAPTMRQRVFVVGWSESSKNQSFLFPPPTHGSPIECSPGFFYETDVKPYVSVGDVLEGLPDVNTPDAVTFLNHTGRPHRPETIAYIKNIPEGKQVMQSYRYRAPWNGLTQSLTAGVDYATKSYIHPKHHREMSVREYARIHGFPDTWGFCGNHHNGIKQVANAVPIPLGEAVLATAINNIFRQNL